MFGENTRLSINRGGSQINASNFFTVMDRLNRGSGVRISVQLDLSGINVRRRGFRTVANRMSQTEVYTAMGQLGEAAKDYAQNPDNIRIVPSNTKIELLAGSTVIAQARRHYDGVEYFDLDVREDCADALGLKSSTLF